MEYRNYTIEMGEVDQKDNKRSVAVYRAGQISRFRLGRHHSSHAKRVAEHFIDQLIDDPDNLVALES